MINKISFVFIFLICFSCAHAQNFQIYGAVLDSLTEEPLIGVNVKIDKELGFITDLNGQFK